MLSSPEASCSTFRWSSVSFFWCEYFLLRRWKLRWPQESSKKVLKEIITTSILCQSWEVIFVVLLPAQERQLSHSYQQQVVQTCRLDLPWMVCVTRQIISRAFMPHVAEQLVSSVAGWSPRFTKSALLLWLQEQKGERVWSNWQHWQQQGFFFSAEMTADLQPPHFLRLVCEMVAGRRGGGRALGWSGRS